MSVDLTMFEESQEREAWLAARLRQQGLVGLQAGLVPFVGGTTMFEGGGDVTAQDGTGRIQIGASFGQNIGIDNNEIQARNSNAVSRLYLNYEGGDVRVGPGGGSDLIELNGKVHANGNYMELSGVSPRMQINDTDNAWSYWMLNSSDHLYFLSNLGDGNKGESGWKSPYPLYFDGPEVTAKVGWALELQAGVKTNSGQLKVTTPSGWLEIGPANSSWAHFDTDRPNFYFSKDVHIAGDVVRYSSGGWQSANLLNGWTNYGGSYARAGYQKMPDGNVLLRGLIRYGTLEDPAFRLPAGYRPYYTQLVGTVSTGGDSRVDIRDDGYVIPRNDFGAGTGYFSLDSIIFHASG